MISGVFSVRILGGWKNSSGARPSHSTIRRKFARSGRSPFSTRARVLNGTSLWAAAARRLRPSSFAVLADAHFQGVDVDGFVHGLPPSGACP